MEKIFYLAQVFGAINRLAILFLFIGLVGTIIPAGFYLSDEVNDKDRTILKKIIKFCLASLIIGISCIIFVPKEKTYLFMVGGRYIDSVVSENPEIQELPKNTIELLNEYIKSETENLRKEE